MLKELKEKLQLSKNEIYTAVLEYDKEKKNRRIKMSEKLWEKQYHINMKRGDVSKYVILPEILKDVS